MSKMKNPVLYGHLQFIRNSVYTAKRPIEVSVIKSAEPIEFKNLDKNAFTPVQRGYKWGRRHSCAWFRLKGTLSDGIENPVILIDIGKFGGEGLVYNADGEAVCSFTNVWTPVDIPQSAGSYRAIALDKDKKKFELYADCGYNGFLMLDIFEAKFRGAFIAGKNNGAYEYYYDYLAILLLFSQTDDKALKKELSGALKASFSLFKKGSIAEARAHLGGIYAQGSKNTLELSAVGHGHLDLAWLWPIRETKRKAARTLINAVNNIEKYPGYIYGTSQPQQLLWVKENQPELYERVKKAVNDGRIEIQGGFWAECDTNLPCGESLVRQAVYGTKFIFNEFGLKSPVCWLPDAFGYSGNLPQILKKCGMDYFSTIKLAWNKINKFPFRTFFWEGIDNSKVLVHMPPEGDYNSTASPRALIKAEKNYPERELNTALLVYGGGDGGGGPGEAHLELIKRSSDLKSLPKVVNRTAAEFFKRLSALNISHSHKGELYLETHQGTLTTQAKNKYYNRLCERLLHNAEFLAVSDFCRGVPYPFEFFDKLWREILLYQFHDIIPGSSITRVNEEARAGYQKIIDALNKFAYERLNGNGGKLCAANLMPFKYDGIAKYNNEFYEVSVGPYSAAEIKKADIKKDNPKITSDTMDNGILKLTFNKNGEICSCVNTAGHESAAGVLNRLTVYTDRRMIPFNAWDIDIKYPSRHKTHLKAVKSRTYTDGLDAVRENEYRYKKCRITQRVILPYKSDTVKFETEADWHTKHKMLRADFFPSSYGETVKCDIQFGHIERPTRNTTSVDYAQFEVCAHKWVAVENESGGFAILNDCKYGHRVKEGSISLNLLRSPVFPDKKADRGHHSFTYAFCPFGKSDIGKVIQEGYKLNNPLVFYSGKPFDSFVFCNNGGVIIETVKAAENGDGIVLRLYETLGRNCNTALYINNEYCIENAEFNDMLENFIEHADLKNLSFTPFEVKTIKLRGIRKNGN